MFTRNDKYNVNISIIDVEHRKFIDIVNKAIVEDTEIGIREEYHEQIFKIFKRLRDIKTEGTCVGLVIVKKIVELHAGKLRVESPLNYGRGSRFCFTIPIMNTKTSK